MSGKGNQRAWLVWALALSLLFNLGVAVALGVARLGLLEEEGVGSAPADEAAGAGAAVKTELKLTSEQLERAEERRREMLAEVARLRTLVGEERQRLWRQVADGETERKALSETIGRITRGQEAVQEAVVDYLLWLRGTLSQEQQRFFAAFVSERMCRCPACDGGCVRSSVMPDAGGCGCGGGEPGGGRGAGCPQSLPPAGSGCGCRQDPLEQVRGSRL